MSLKNTSRLLCLLLLSAGLSVSVQAQENVEESDGNDGQRSSQTKVVKVGEQAVTYLWHGRESEVFGANGWGKWRYYMHGQTDENASPLLWSRYFPAFYAEHQASQRVVNDVMSTDMYSLELSGGTDIISENPIVDAEGISGRHGGRLRMHVWISGEGTGEGGTLWESAPQVSLILINTNGEHVERADGRFRTRGTFSWFCYYVDMVLPENLGGADLAGIFVRLANPVSGRAYFCTPSIEWLDSDRAEALRHGLPQEYADPKRGTFAPNPDYDEMPMNFFFGLPSGERCVWRFIEGNYKTSSLALSYNLEEYLSSYRNDWFHCTHAFPYLLQVYTVGVKAKRSPQLQQDWATRLVGKLASLQDKKTGLWMIDGRGNLPLTYLIATRCFAPSGQTRPREPMRLTPWNSADNRTLDCASELARSLLSEQRRNSEGVLAGWNKYAFQGQDLVAASRDAVAFDCESTAMAVTLLSQCRPLVGTSLQNEIDESVKVAYQFAMKHILSDSRLFFENERQQKLCQELWDYVFLEGTQALDMKMAPAKVNAAQAEASLTKKGDAMVTVRKFAEGHVSLRVYGMVSGQGEDTVNDASLLGILRNKALPLRASDPLLIVQAFCDSRIARTPGMTADAVDATVIAAKAGHLETVYVKDVQDGEFAVIEIPEIFRKGRLMVVAADAYGNLSAPLLVDVP